MKIHVPPEWRGAAILSAGSAGFLVLLGVELMVNPTLPPLQAAGSDNGAPDKAAALAIPSLRVLPPIESFSDFVERPLFSASRKADPVAAADVPTQPVVVQTPTLGQYQLTGVILSPKRDVALLRDVSGKVTTVARGQDVGGWMIDSIQKDRVVLKYGAETREVVFAPNAATGTGPQPNGRAPTPFDIRH